MTDSRRLSVGVAASLVILLLATSGCTMDSQIRRGRAFAICDRSPMVDPWLARNAEAQRRRRFNQAIARQTAGKIAVRPLSAAEAEAAIGGLPTGYGEGVLLLEMTVTIAATSPAGGFVSIYPSHTAEAPWRAPSIDETYRLFGTYPPPRARRRQRRTLFGGALFVLTVGTVDVENRWGALRGGGRPSARSVAARAPARRLISRGSPRSTTPGAPVTFHRLIARTEGGTGPVRLWLEFQPRPGDCGFMRGRLHMHRTFATNGPSEVVFDAGDFEMRP